MIARLKQRATFANVVALLALLIALGTGGAFAASKLAKNTVGPKQVKNNSLSGKEIKDDSLLGTDIDESSLSVQRGATGPQGVTGPEGPLPATLPSGKTLRGFFTVSGIATGVGSAALGPVSFTFPLASKPTGQIVAKGGASTSQCPGSLDQPEAAAGFVCVYFGDSSNLNPSSPASLCSHTGGCNATMATKNGVAVEIFSNAVGFFSGNGTWAVTAP